MQFTYAGGPAEFNQPDINSELGFNTSVSPNPQNGTVLGRYKLDTSVPGPSPTVGGDPIEPYSGETNSLNNFGVPGATVGQLLSPATGSQQGNPFYRRFASNPGNSTVLGDAIAAQPTFFSLWIGSNDVLGYAVSGGTSPGMTNVTDFQARYNTTVNQLMNNTSADGVLATIPPVTVLPYFRALTYNTITLTEQEATELNTNFASYNQVLDVVAQNFPNQSQEDMDLRKVNYQEGANPILVNDPTLDDLEDEFDQLESQDAISAQQRQALVPYEQSRPLRVGQIQGQPQPELVTLAAGSVLGTEYNPQSSTPTPIGIVIPLGYDSPESASGDAYYLTIPEIAEILTRTEEFNNIITSAANGNDRLALYDINNPNGSFFDLFGIVDGNPGLNVNGVTLQPDFSPNGVFSTDGIHPNQRGNAILANEFIRVIEENFDASIPEVNVLNLPSVQVCSEQVGQCLSVQQQQQKINASIGQITYDISAVR